MGLIHIFRPTQTNRQLKLPRPGFRLALCLVLLVGCAPNPAKLSRKCDSGNQDACLRLAELAKSAENPRLRQAAVGQLKDQALLAEIASTEEDWAVHVAAVDRLNDEGLARLTARYHDFSKDPLRSIRQQRRLLRLDIEKDADVVGCDVEALFHALLGNTITAAPVAAQMAVKVTGEALSESYSLLVYAHSGETRYTGAVVNLDICLRLGEQYLRCDSFLGEKEPPGSIDDLDEHKTRDSAPFDEALNQEALPELVAYVGELKGPSAVRELVTRTQHQIRLGGQEQLRYLRVAAVQNLQDTALLEKLAQNERDLDVSLAVKRRLEELREQKRLIEAATKDKSRRRGALAQLEEQGQLPDAVQEVLADFAQHDEKPKDALIDRGQPVHQPLLSISGRDASAGEVAGDLSGETLSSLADDFEMSAEELDAMLVRAIAAEQLKDQALLAQLAQHDEFHMVRLAAVKRLKDPAPLAQLAQHDEDREVRRIAAERLEDQTLLTEVAQNATDLTVRSRAAEKLTDQGLLAQLAQHDQSSEVREAAVERLEDQALLVKIAQNDEEDWVRRAAVERLEDQTLLTGIAQNDRAEVVRRRAKERLAELSGRR